MDDELSAVSGCAGVTEKYKREILLIRHISMYTSNEYILLKKWSTETGPLSIFDK